MKQSPIEIKVKTRENPVKYICIDNEGTYLCFGKKDLKNCLLQHQNAQAFKASEIDYDIVVNLKK